MCRYVCRSSHESLYVYWCLCVSQWRTLQTSIIRQQSIWQLSTSVRSQKTGHKPSSPPYPWTHTLTRPIQQERTAPVHPRHAMIANCFFPLSVYPHFSFHRSLLSLPPIILQSLYRTKASEGHSIWTAAILAQRVLHESVNLHTHACVSIRVYVHKCTHTQSLNTVSLQPLYYMKTS